MTNNTGCKLYGSFFENAVQFSMAIFAMLTLIIKWQFEEEIHRRTWKIFLLDSSKQGLSGLIAHFMNMLIAFLMFKHFSNTDECGWYFVSFFMDTILGTYITYELMNLLSFWAKKNKFVNLEESGNYGDSNYFKDILYIWFIQVFSWCTIITISRIFVGFIVFLFSPILLFVADGISLLFTNHPNLLFICVMVICPGLLNIIQIWIQDYILMKKININTEDSEQQLI